ncbi:MAG: hypothetical protein H6821_17370 [Planctomycetaceae bacterium]|nr:hypothetical protein [Deltaproteobacteria bacterium]MCB9875940.1 hypothetical protein [Planctomycetaceae bacterium]
MTYQRRDTGEDAMRLGREQLMQVICKYADVNQEDQEILKKKFEAQSKSKGDGLSGQEVDSYRVLEFMQGVGPVPSIPFDEFVRHAARHNRQLVQRGDCFPFVRAVRSHPHCQHLHAEVAAQEVDAIFGRDHWDENLGNVMTDCREYFFWVWFEIRKLLGDQPLLRAVARAERHTIWFDRDRDAKYNRFLSIIYFLQGENGGMDILIPVKTYAPLLGCSMMQISRYTGEAKRRGFLRLTKEASRKHRKAAQYQVDVSRMREVAGIEFPESAAAARVVL